jgi:bacillolysin
MANGFDDLHFHVANESDDDVRAAGSRPMAVRGAPRGRGVADDLASMSEEAAARRYLSHILGRDARASVRGLTAPERPEVVPDMRLQDTQRSGITNTNIVRFVQTKSSVPIFGSRAVVELDASNELLAVDASLADVKGVSHIPALSVAQALERIADTAGIKVAELQSVNAPELTFYHDEEKDEWHLAYFFKDVPAAPPGFVEGTKSHGVGRSRSQVHPELHYLVDAHDGKILLYWSSAPTADIPVECEGKDEEGTLQKFFGREINGGAAFELTDPMRNIKTFDFAGKDIDTAAPPANPIHGASRVFTNMEGAVSAHVHAKRVHEFLMGVLVRHGVDNKGMELISYVNCTSPNEEPPPEWNNAAWWKGRMWYGQSRENGRLRSWSRHLDIVAHELAHAITQFTADLMYFRQSGALNESLSDICGVIISNWDWSKPDTGGDVATWVWEIGPGLGDDGLPLRDMSDPRRTGDPDHMNKYLNTNADNGGVHTNSNIHNKAAYNVLTAKDAQGKSVFTPREVAVLYYLCLTRLNKLATFVQARDGLLSVAKTYFSGQSTLQQKLDAITNAYADVGI